MFPFFKDVTILKDETYLKRKSEIKSLVRNANAKLATELQIEQNSSTAERIKLEDLIITQR